MPARLRMNVIETPASTKPIFELWSLAVSAINGCGACIDAHEKVLPGGRRRRPVRSRPRALCRDHPVVAVAIEAGGAAVLAAAE